VENRLWRGDWRDWGIDLIDWIDSIGLIGLIEIGTSLAQCSNAFGDQEFKRHFVPFKDSRCRHLNAAQQRLKAAQRLLNP
jgi:hypothetical protein